MMPNKRLLGLVPEAMRYILLAQPGGRHRAMV